MDKATLLAAIAAGVTAIPAGLKLVQDGMELLNASDKAEVVARLDAEADAQHEASAGV